MKIKKIKIFNKIKIQKFLHHRQKLKSIKSIEMKILPLSKLKISDLVKQLKKDSNIFGKNSLLNDLF